MSDSELKFEIVDNNRFKLETSQVIDADELCNRIIAMEVRKANFEMQIELGAAAIKRQEELEANLAPAIVEITKDLNYAYEFLKKTHHGELISKIEKTMENKKKEFELQKQQALSE